MGQVNNKKRTKIKDIKTGNNKVTLYKNKINYKFQKNPNLKFRLNKTEDNEGKQGVNDIFEVFISYKDNKEYLSSSNRNNYNLNIFQLLDNKKILSLKGHKNSVISIRYFINQKNYKEEYLISSDMNYKVIIWDIKNNYNLKILIQTDYTDNNYIESCLLIFPHNWEKNYIIISKSNIFENNGILSTRRYSLSNGKYINSIKESINLSVCYLLSWYNKIENKYYIIQLALNKIVITDLLEDKLYSKLINPKKNEITINYNNSGFIYTKENKDYLCSSSTSGYINIWDLYNKNLYKFIDTKRCWLMSIIEWNNKYIIVTDINGPIKIIDIENNKIVCKIDSLEKGMTCIKKINHPFYGESVFIGGENDTIKLWSI